MTLEVKCGGGQVGRDRKTGETRAASPGERTSHSSPEAENNLRAFTSQGPVWLDPDGEGHEGTTGGAGLAQGVWDLLK